MGMEAITGAAPSHLTSPVQCGGDISFIPDGAAGGYGMLTLNSVGGVVQNRSGGQLYISDVLVTPPYSGAIQIGNVGYGAQAGGDLIFFHLGSNNYYFSTLGAGNPIFEVASLGLLPVNYVQVGGGRTGNPVQIAAVGGDPNVSINFVTQGSGTVNINGVPIAASGNALVNPMTTAGDLIYAAGGGVALALTQDTSAVSAAAGTSQILTVTSTGASKMLALSVVLCNQSGLQAPSVTGIVDNQGNTWVKAIGQNPANHRTGAEIWYVKANATAAVTTVTASFDRTCSSTMRFYEVVGATTGTSLDQTSGGSGVSKSQSSGSAPVTAQGNELVLAVLGIADAGTTWSGLTPGFTNDTPTSNPVAQYSQSEQAGHMVAPATGSYAYAGTAGGTDGWAAVIATFKGSGTIAGTPSRLGIGTTGQVLTVSGGLPVWAPTSASAITAGALPTVGTTTGNAFQASSTRAVTVMVPITYTPTAGAAATAVIAVSPDNTTFTTVSTNSVPAGTALDSFVLVTPIPLPTGWYAKVTVTNATIPATSVYY